MRIKRDRYLNQLIERRNKSYENQAGQILESTD